MYILVDQNILLNKPKFFGYSDYFVKITVLTSVINVPIDCDTPLKVTHRDEQGDKDKNTNITHPNKVTVTQDASTNTSNRITVTQDASVNTSKRIDKGSDY